MMGGGYGIWGVGDGKGMGRTLWEQTGERLDWDRAWEVQEGDRKSDGGWIGVEEGMERQGEGVRS